MKRGVVGNQEFSIYVGLDWGTEFHWACVLDSSGKVVRECKVDHSGQAITDFVRLLNTMVHGRPESVSRSRSKLRGGPSSRPFWKAALRCSRSTPSSGTGFGIATAWREPKTIAGMRRWRRIRYGPTSTVFGGSPCSIRTSFVSGNFPEPRRISAKTFGGSSISSINCCFDIIRSCCN